MDLQPTCLWVGRLQGEPETMNQNIRQEHKSVPSLIFGQQNVEVSVRGYTGQNTDEGHKLTPKI